eukprot:NODE_640_length_1548_cov_291.448966_g527_i0.p1 GENE.NODE_640_length_1548_cov_291.448966_g527_i0~~NODE_640_length_1548_cov_291.448966_g527_i0.p1  ORF type:complete len:446 (-),score=17.81 NODE_640_length_1548_cov_291.448966_g527_i0:54-1391(-)
MFKLGGLGERELEKLKQKAKELGKDSFSFAFFMDKQKEERERGVTITCTTKEFFTKKYHYTIIDAPGHRDFIKNMIGGASQADVALLMVPADKGGFEVAIQKGNHKKGLVKGQTRQHAQLCYLLGIKKVIVGINKMDGPTVKYDQKRYEEIRSNMLKMLEKFGYKTPEKTIPVIPMSGWKGDNLIKVSENMPWYSGWKVKMGKKEVKGVTLLDALNKYVKPPKRKPDDPVRMPVSGVYNIKGVGDVVTGRVEQGTLIPGMEVEFVPSGATGKVFSVEMHHKRYPSAKPGDNVGLNVKGLPKEKLKKPKAGDVMFLKGDTKDKTPHRKCTSFTATVFIQDHPGKLKPAGKDGKGGFTPTVHVRTAKVPCKMVKINWKMGKSTGKAKVSEGVQFVEANDQAEITFEPQMNIFVESFKTCQGLGRVAVMDSGSLVMLGMVSTCTYADK